MSQSLNILNNERIETETSNNEVNNNSFSSVYMQTEFEQNDRFSIASQSNVQNNSSNINKNPAEKVANSQISSSVIFNIQS